MTSRFTALGCLFLALLVETTLSASEPRCVVAYLPEYRLAAFQPDDVAGLTDLVCFSIEPTATGELDSSRLSAESIRTLRAACDKHKVRLTVALGGWERSHEFPKMSASPAARRSFAKELTRFCLEHRLDGADFDWEHPHGAAEEQAYGDLMVETHLAFAPRGLKLSAALNAWQRVPQAGYEALDRIHLMAYDRNVPRHATLEAAREDIDRMLERPGVTPGKLCLGMPCYGRKLQDHDQSATYAEIVSKHTPPPEADEVDGWYFNGIRTVQAKARLVRERKLGGVMFWELGQDARGARSLVRAASSVQDESK